MYRGGRLVEPIVRAIEEIGRLALGDTLPTSIPSVMARDGRDPTTCAGAHATPPQPPPSRPLPTNETENFVARQLGCNISTETRNPALRDFLLVGGAVTDLRAAQRRVEALLREIDVSDLEQLLLQSVSLSAPSRTFMAKIADDLYMQFFNKILMFLWT